MNYEISGKLIFKEETQHISEKFQKREFVIEVENEKNPQWNDFVKVQLIQDRCDLLENIALNEDSKFISTSGAENGKTRDKYLISPIWKVGGLKKSPPKIRKTFQCRNTG